MRFTDLCGRDWSVSESSDTSPRSLTLEAFLAPLTAVRVLTSLSCLVPPAEVVAVWFCVLPESADLVLLFLPEACLSACLACAVRATCLPCSVITTLGISLSFTRLFLTPWTSLGTLGTIFPIRAGFGVLGIIFPMRGAAPREWSEAWRGFAWLSNDD